MPTDDHGRSLSNFTGFNCRLPSRKPEPEHVADRPSWDCRACGAPWPCDLARKELLRQQDANPTAIATYMWMRLEEYAFDQGVGPPADAFDRFLKWTRRGN